MSIRETHQSTDFQIVFWSGEGILQKRAEFDPSVNHTKGLTCQPEPSRRPSPCRQGSWREDLAPASDSLAWFAWRPHSAVSLHGCSSIPQLAYPTPSPRVSASVFTYIWPVVGCSFSPSFSSFTPQIPSASPTSLPPKYNSKMAFCTVQKLKPSISLTWPKHPHPDPCFHAKGQSPQSTRAILLTASISISEIQTLYQSRPPASQVPPALLPIPTSICPSNPALLKMWAQTSSISITDGTGNADSWSQTSELGSSTSWSHQTRGDAEAAAEWERCSKLSGFFDSRLRPWASLFSLLTRFSHWFSTCLFLTSHFWDYLKYLLVFLSIFCFPHPMGV